MMQRKSSFPVANSRIKMPDAMPLFDITVFEDDDQQKKRQQLINFGHSQWGFNNWSWSVSKQDLDFVDFSNGKYVVGVVAFVSITVKSFDIHRENIGYATTTAPMKGSAIYQARKGAVTNALRETLLSFGGNVAIELMDLLEPNKHEAHNPAVSGAPDLLPENNQNLANKPTNEVKNINKPMLRKESVDVAAPNPVTTVNKPHPNINTVIPKVVVPPPPPPVAKAHPMPANLPPAANKPFPPAAANQRVPPPAPHPRPNSNVSFVLQPVMGGVVPPMYAPPPRMPHLPPPHMFPNPAYYAEYTAGPWHFTYEGYDRHHGNVNLNFNIPPKNLVVNSRAGSVECKNACGRPAGVEGEPLQYAAPPQSQGCWIKPTIFYDGFWTEQKVKRWVAEQVEKQFPEDCSLKSSSPSNNGLSDGNSK